MRSDSYFANDGDGFNAATLGSLAVSIIVLVVVSLSKNPTVAASAASAPTGIPLALWIATTRAEANGEDAGQAMVTFLVGCFKGIASTACFVAVAYASARFGLTSGPLSTVLAGFAGWYLCAQTLAGR